MALSTAALLMPRRRRLSRNSMRPTLSSLDGRADKNLLRFAGARAESVPMYTRAPAWGTDRSRNCRACSCAPLDRALVARYLPALRATALRHLPTLTVMGRQDAPVQVPFTNLPPRRLNLVVFA